MWANTNDALGWLQWLKAFFVHKSSENCQGALSVNWLVQGYLTIASAFVSFRIIIKDRLLFGKRRATAEMRARNEMPDDRNHPAIRKPIGAVWPSIRHPARFLAGKWPQLQPALLLWLCQQARHSPHQLRSRLQGNAAREFFPRPLHHIPRRPGSGRRRALQHLASGRRSQPRNLLR